MFTLNFGKKPYGFSTCKTQFKNSIRHKHEDLSLKGLKSILIAFYLILLVAPTFVRNKLGSTTAKAILITCLLVIATLGTIALFPQAAKTPNASVTLEQCRNGQVGPPILKSPCNASPLASADGWVAGNAGGSQAHWREGDFIAYRADFSGPPGTYNLTMHYQVTSGGQHAIDYLGSVNATETFSTTPSTFYANKNDPCTNDTHLDLPNTECTSSIAGFDRAASPTSSFPIPAADLLGSDSTSCGGSLGAGLPTPTQVPGKMQLWAPSGSAITNIAYLSQNSGHGGGCITTIEVLFTITGSSGATQSAVLAWGGHIASELVWGLGNSAAFVNGSPYHMSVDFLNGASQGSQDRSLSTSAVFFTPTISTQVYTSANVAVPIGGTVVHGTSVHDTATISGASDLAGGTVTYTLYSMPSIPVNGTCSGTVSSTQTVTVTNAGLGPVVPNSTSVTLGAGYWGYNVTYSGDTNKNTFGAVLSTCESFQVVTVLTSLSTTVSPSSITLSNDTTPSVVDTAALSGGSNPTGSITFKLYFGANSSAAIAACVAGTSPIFTSVNSSVNGNGAYKSGPFTPTSVGYYVFNATYSGDGTNDPSAGSCSSSLELLTVSPAKPTITTQVSPSIVTLGQPAKDNASLQGGYHPTGTITFQVHAGACNGSVVAGFSGSSSSIVNVNGDGFYLSAAFSAPAPGAYVWNATYSGDGNNTRVSVCGGSPETLTVTSIPKITAFGYTNTPLNSDPTIGNGTVVYTVNITNYGASAVNLSGSLAVTGTARINNGLSCSLTLSGSLAAGQTKTFTLTCTYSGSSGNTVLATLNASFTDVNGVTAAVSGSQATIEFTVQT